MTNPKQTNKKAFCLFVRRKAEREEFYLLVIVKEQKIILTLKNYYNLKTHS